MNALNYVTYHTPDTLKTVGNVVQAQQMFLEKGANDDDIRMYDMCMREMVGDPEPENWNNVVPLRV